MTSRPQQLSFLLSEPAPSKRTEPRSQHTEHVLAVELRPRGPRVLVHPTEGCTCGQTMENPCWHIKRALQVWERSASGLRFLAKSGFHKEVRRGDLTSAFRWARLATHFHGRSWPKTYLKRILLEDSRALTLLHEWKSLAGLSWQSCLRKGVAMPKKWELQARQDVFAEYVEAFVATEQSPLFEDEAQLRAAFDKTHDRANLFRLFWRAMRRRDRWSVLWQIEALRERAIERGGMARFFVEEGLWDTNPFYGPKILIELLTDAWDERANQLDDNVLQQPLPVDEQLVIPAAPAYIYDCHELKGQRRLIKHWEEIHPNRPLPRQIDLRWSGMLAGVCWREFATQQAPQDFKKLPWEAVHIPQETWEHAMACDRFFYPRFYEQLQRHNARAA